MNQKDFQKGAQLYAEGRYWEAHEAWEKVWRASEDPETKLLLQGLIQVCAALYKVYEKREVASAARLFQRAVSKLEELPDAVQNVHVAPFLAAATGCRDVLEHDQDQGTLKRERLPRLVLLATLMLAAMLLSGCTSCGGSDGSSRNQPLSLSASQLPTAPSTSGSANVDATPGAAKGGAGEIHEDGRAYVPRTFTFDVAHTEIFVEDMKMGTDFGQVLERTGGAVAINGGFFDTDEKPLGLCISAGKTISPFKKSMSGGVLTVDVTHATLFPTETFDPDANGAATFAVQCRPRLVVDGRVNIKRDDGKRSARTALCVKNQGTSLVVVLVRDVSDPSFGPSLYALGNYLAADGCESALNLDGGPSTGVAWRDATGAHVEKPVAGIRHAIILKQK
jgi:hypothetical protein